MSLDPHRDIVASNPKKYIQTFVALETKSRSLSNKDKETVKQYTILQLHHISVVADMGKAFWNIGVKLDGKEAVWFLWEDNSFGATSKLETWKIYNFSEFIVDLAIRIMFHLKETICYHLKHYLEEHQDIDREIVNKMKNSLFSKIFFKMIF